MTLVIDRTSEDLGVRYEKLQKRLEEHQREARELFEEAENLMIEVKGMDEGATEAAKMSRREYEVHYRSLSHVLARNIDGLSPVLHNRPGPRYNSGS